MPVVSLRDASEIPRAMYESLSAMLKEPGLPEGEIAGIKEQMERLAAYLRQTGVPIPDTDEAAILLLDSADLQPVLGDRNFGIPPYGDGPLRTRELLFLDLPTEEEVDQLIAKLAVLGLSDILWVVGRDEATSAGGPSIGRVSRHFPSRKALIKSWKRRRAFLGERVRWVASAMLAHSVAETITT